MPTTEEDLQYAIKALGQETVRRLAHDKFITDKGLWQEFIRSEAYARAYRLAPEPQITNLPEPPAEGMTVTELAIKNAYKGPTVLDAVLADLTPASNIAYNRKQGTSGHYTAEQDFARISDYLEDALKRLRMLKP